MTAFPGILGFSAIETVTVVIWAAILGLGDDMGTSTKVAATIALFVGYVIEHIVAFKVSTGRSPFQPRQ